MNTANFKNNGNSRYPLSTDTLDFMQKQIHLAYGLASLYGENYIIRQSTADTDGLIVIKGELMPLKGTRQGYIAIGEKSTNIEALGLTFAKARVERYAYYTGIGLATRYRAANFPVMQPIAQHLVPKGVINMWSGSPTDLPYGWALCDGTNGTPDLRGRFIVGYNPSDTDYATVGNAGGAKMVTLTTSQMPSHSHGGTLTTSTDGVHSHGVTMSYRGEDGKSQKNGTTILCTDQPVTGADARSVKIVNSGSHDHTVTLTSQGSNAPHENRPPYYTLAYIMKII